MKFINYSLSIVLIVISTGCSTLKKEQPTVQLHDSINRVASSDEIKVWNPYDRELYSVTNQLRIAKLADLIRSIPIEYDEEDSISRQNGSVCACLPVVIEIATNDYISIHGHNIILNNHTSFEPVDDEPLDLDTVLIAAGLMGEPVHINLSHDQALVLLDFISDGFFVKRSENHDGATKIVLEEIIDQMGYLYPEGITDENFDDFMKETRERVIQYY